jgi:hypothetical protein
MRRFAVDLPALAVYYRGVMKMCTKHAGAVLVSALAALLVTQSAARGAMDFSRYEIILTRKPFGIVSVVSSNRAGVQQAPEGAWIKEYRMCAISEPRDGGACVGLIEIKNNKSYYLRMGESRDGLMLVDADIEKEGALVRKDMQEYWIYMKSDASAGASNALGVATGSAGVISAGIPAYTESYAERLRKRRESVRVRTIEPPKMSEEQLAQHLKEYQMELIRAGGEKGPPLPMELTPEMDAQLVAEGVLPPLQ